MKCPCNEQRLYAQCCEHFHAGALAPTAEVLMRSRYSAYVLRLEGYLLSSWHTSTRPKSLDLAAETPVPKWLGLKLLRHESKGDSAIVEFVAKFKVGGGSAQGLHELSRFVREDGRWFYVDGDLS